MEEASGLGESDGDVGLAFGVLFEDFVADEHGTGGFLSADSVEHGFGVRVGAKAEFDLVGAIVKTDSEFRIFPPHFLKY